MAKTSYGKTASGRPLTDDLIEELSAEAEAGYEAREIVRRRPGRPAMGSAAAQVESVRLDPELRAALTARADRDGEPTSAVIRDALRSYLSAPSPISPTPRAGSPRRAGARRSASSHSLTKRAPNSGKRWTRSEEKKLRALAKRNVPTAVIATKLGRSQKGVAGKAGELALDLRPTAKGSRKKQAR